MNRKLLVTFCVVSLVMAGLIAPSPASAANLFALDYYEFTGNSEFYEIYLTVSDTLISNHVVYCNGVEEGEVLGWDTNNFGVGGIGVAIRSVTSVWNNHGTFVHESGACEDGASGSGGASGEKSFGPAPNYHKQSIRTDDAGNLNLPVPKNGSMHFPAGTCSDKCTITPSLPAGAASSLPADVVATMYVRLGGGEGIYTVCFDVGDLASPVIYRYISGAWVAQPVSISGGQVCTSANGDGAFAFGGS